MSQINTYEIRSPSINMTADFFFFFPQADTKKAEDAKVYLGLPAAWLEVEQEEKQTGKSFHHSGVIAVTKDSFQIASLTCSTKLTQNGNTSCSLETTSCQLGHLTDGEPIGFTLKSTAELTV